MKMMLINEDNSTTKVNIETLNGNVVYMEDEKTRKIIAEMKLPEILFHENQICITGYVLQNDKSSYCMKSFTLKNI